MSNGEYRNLFFFEGNCHGYKKKKTICQIHITFLSLKYIFCVFLWYDFLNIKNIANKLFTTEASYDIMYTAD